MRAFTLLGLIIIILSTNFFVAKSQATIDKIMKVVIMNDNRKRPLVTGIDFFWKSNQLDTITFSGDLYFDMVQHNLTRFKQDTVKNNFTVQAAILFFQNNNCDTVYTDCFFTNWLIGKDSFSAPDDFLEKMFRPLYLGFYKDMRKGDY